MDNVLCRTSFIRLYNGSSVNGNTLIASVAGEGVYRSTDNGNNWAFSGNGLPDFYTQSFFIKGNLIYAGTHYGVYVSSNNGTSWQYSSSGINYLTVVNIFSHNNFLFAGTSNGIYYSLNGENWNIRSNGLRIIDVNFLIKHNSYIFAGSYSNGIYKSQDNGNTWVNIDFIYPLVDLISLGQYLYALSYVYNGFYRSSDDGVEWDYVIIDSNNLRVNAITSMDNYLFAATTEGVYRSSNDGKTWTAINNGVADSLVYSIIANGNNVFIATINTQNSGKIPKSSDNGDNWTAVSTNPPNNYFKLLTKKDATIYASRGDKLYSFNTHGENWTQISTLVGAINQITITPAFFVAATQAGIFLSTNNGVNWENKNEGFNNSTILGNNSYTLLIDNDKVYASQKNESVWIRPLSNLIEGVPITIIPSDYELKQNYPNPFNPSTTIEFSLPIAGNVKLYIYDISGRKVASLLNRDMGVGNYKISWNSNSVSSGIYFYKLVTKHFTETKKMVLLK